jgi:sulfatase modifying factor 1
VRRVVTFERVLGLVVAMLTLSVVAASCSVDDRTLHGTGTGGMGGAGVGGTAGGSMGGAGSISTDGLPPGALTGNAGAPPTLVEWVTLPGSSFEMGSATGPTGADSVPQHLVAMPTFEIGRTEVTVAAYAACIAAAKCRTPFSQAATTDCNWSSGPTQDLPNNPINCVSWARAGEYCAWIGGSLPSEAQWEYAARSGGQDVTYPWGDAAPACELVAANSAATGGLLPVCSLGTIGSSVPVCSIPAGNTQQGLCDMAGIVSEWIEDVWVAGYDGAPIDGSARTGDGTDRVVRGGNLNDPTTDFLQTTARAHTSGSDTQADVSLGFRCVRLPSTPASTDGGSDARDAGSADSDGGGG